MTHEPKELPTSPHLRRELVKRIDRKHRHDARMRGERFAPDAGDAARLASDRERWIELLAKTSILENEAGISVLVDELVALPGADLERSRALRTVRWEDVEMARRAAA